MSAALRQRRPWPMKWIALVIVLVIGPYTYLRWHYRKPGPAFEPYHDLKEQANVKRLIAAGFQRITVDADRPADPLRFSGSLASTKAGEGGLPKELSTTLVEAPRIPDEIVSVTAPSTANTMLAYPIEFTCALPDIHQQPGTGRLYVRDGEIVVVPELERLSGDLLSRNRENRIRLTLAPGALKTGKYIVTIVATRNSRTWTLEVK